MKKLFKVAALPLIVLAVVVGCVATNPAPPTVSQIPGFTVTNPPATPGAPPTIIFMPPSLVTNPPNPAFLPDPRINQYSNLLNQLAGYAGAVPAAAPYSAVAQLAIAGVGAIIGGLSGFFAQKKSTNAANNMLAAVVQGVESGTSSATVTADSIKQAIQDRATAAGVQHQLDAVVKKLT